MAFIGVEPLREAYAETCRTQGVSFAYFQTTSGRPWVAWWRLWRWLSREKPAAILMHSSTALAPCFAYRLLNGGRLVAVEHTAAEIRTKREWLLCALTHFAADRVVFLTEEAQRKTLERIGMFGRPAKWTVISNGVDLEDFRPGTSRSGDSAVRLGMAGRFAPPKRYDVLTEALDELIRLKPDLSFELTLAGGGKMLAEVQEAARRRGFADRIAFVGVLGESDLAKWFKSLDLYVHASDAENQSTAILQAMASGLAVIASDIPSIRTQVTVPLNCGLLASEQTGAAFAGAIIELLDDPSKRKRLADAGRANAEALYGSDAMFKAYDMVLRS
jgi:glycosyltransferase involved in cell wall biosynthesis